MTGLKAPLRKPRARALETLARRSRRRVGLAVIYHRLGGRGEAQAERAQAAFPRDLFEQEVGYLQSRYRLVRASDLTEAVAARRAGEPLPAAITFDDEDPSLVEIAAPVLSAIGAPATFFLTGSSLDGPRAFWWQRLQIAIDRGLATPERLLDAWPAGAPRPRSDLVQDIATAIKSMRPAQREQLDAKLLEWIGADPSDAGLRAADVRQLAQAGFEIGAHTLRHEVLPQLSDEELEIAITEGRAELEEASGTAVRTIAYPYGYVDRRVADAARAAGYEFGFTCERAPVVAGGDPLLMPRIEDPSRYSVSRFAVELALTARVSTTNGRM